MGLAVVLFAKLCIFLFLGFGSRDLFAAGLQAEIINYYALILEFLGIRDAHEVHLYGPMLASMMSLVLLFIGGVIFRSSIKVGASTGEAEDVILPPEKLSLRALFETILEGLFGLVSNAMGDEKAKQHITLLSTIFLFIFVSNGSGLVPGFPPATESINTNLAMGLTVFLTYHIAGVLEHGPIAYIKHFGGPIWWMAPLFFVIELVSHAARPLSLSLRLFGNVYGDHLVMGVLTGMTYLVVPLVSFFFGALVAVLQSLVFTLLSCTYISMAVAHEEH